MIAKIIAMLGHFIGLIAREVFPLFMEEVKKPQKVTVVGDDETKQAVHTDILSQLPTQKLREDGLIEDRVILLYSDGASITVQNIEGTVWTVQLAEPIPLLEKGTQLTLLDRHVVYLHPVTKVPTAIHRLVIAIALMLVLGGCVFRPDQIVQLPKTPVLIGDIRGNYAEAFTYSVQHNAMLRLGWIDLKQYKGWTFSKFDWAQYLQERSHGQE